MFKLLQCGSESRDCTAPYKVTLDKSYTVRTFIDAIINERKNEWGYIIVNYGNKRFSSGYRYGKLENEMDESVLDKPVISANASGGWTRMDYVIEVRKSFFE